MKTKILLATNVLSITIAIFFALWAAIEFVIYLVKDIPFNWWSVWIILICLGVYIITAIIAIIHRARIATRMYDDIMEGKFFDDEMWEEFGK